jgi:hypothetical protein
VRPAVLDSRLALLVPEVRCTRPHDPDAPVLGSPDPREILHVPKAVLPAAC